MRNVNAIVNHLNHATVVDTINYTYGDSAWSDKLTAYDGQTITYDAIGNPTSYKGATLTWQGRLLVSYAKNGERYEYTYDADGLRTSKKKYVNNVLSFTENYVWVNDKIVAVKRVNSNNTSITVRYLYDADDELFGFVYNNKTYFYIKNPRGDIGGIINADDEIAYYAMDYDAWGNVTYTLAEGLTSAQEAEALHIQEINNFTYRGYFSDSETNLYYLQSRYYDPETGRFINADDSNYIAYDNTPICVNIFAYCANNPINYSDCDGYKIIQSIDKTCGVSNFFNTYNYYSNYSFNCYGYAIGVFQIVNPGYKNKPQIKDKILDNYLKRGEINKIAKLVINDIEVVHRFGTDVTNKGGANFKLKNSHQWLIALRINSEDYHFMKKSYKGIWSFKAGIGGPVIELKPGYTPDMVAWNRYFYTKKTARWEVSSKKGYTSKIIYILVNG